MFKCGDDGMRSTALLWLLWLASVSSAELSAQSLLALWRYHPRGHPLLVPVLHLRWPLPRAVTGAVSALLLDLNRPLLSFVSGAFEV